MAKPEGNRSAGMRQSVEVSGVIFFVRSLWGVIAGWWGRQRRAELDALVGLPIDTRAPKRAAPRRIQKTLCDLLDNLDKSFANLSRSVARESWVHADTRAGLKRMGPTVILREWIGLDSGFVEIVPPKISPLPSAWPGLIFIATNEGDEAVDDDLVAPDFVYAVRLKKPGPTTQGIGGIVYECGMAVRGAKDMDVAWCNFHVGIDSAGTVTAGRERMESRVALPKGGGYTRIEWGIPPVISSRYPRTRDDYQLIAMAWAFHRAFTWWQRKSEYWSVSVRRDGKRATFAVDPSQTKDFFRDRGRTALTAAGKLRPIIHYVQEHKRALPGGRETTVREHIRGLRTFNWRGYECAVTAPKFHTWSADRFYLAGEDEAHFDPGQGYYSLPEIGGFLADSEDSQGAML